MVESVSGESETLKLQANWPNVISDRVCNCGLKRTRKFASREGQAVATHNSPHILRGRPPLNQTRLNTQTSLLNPEKKRAAF
jgi:hypothetical protein